MQAISPPTNHCNNVKADRDIGAYWEKQFGIMAAGFGKSFTLMQLDRSSSTQIFAKENGKWNKWTAPDITIWTAPGEHHEIKHKNPTHDSTYGLEVYRFEALLWFAKETGQSVMYTIHNHDKAGGRYAKINNLAHWETANILYLNEKWSKKRNGPSWVNGKKKTVQIYYWPIELWSPLSNFWQLV